MKHRKTSAARAGVPMALLQSTKRETQTGRYLNTDTVTTVITANIRLTVVVRVCEYVDTASTHCSEGSDCLGLPGHTE